MSESGGPKKHDAPPDRLQELRREGQWYYSRELTGAVLLAIFAALYAAMLPAFGERLLGLAVLLWRPDRIASPDPFRSLEIAFREAGGSLALLTMMALLPLFIAGGLADFLQVGPIFSVKNLWGVRAINPVEGFRSIFLDKQTYLQLATGLVKAVLMLALVSASVWSETPNLIRASRIGPLAAARVFNQEFASFLLMAAVLSLMFGIADYLIQRHIFVGKHKMSDQELREWINRTEGNMETKARLKLLRWNMSMTSARQHERKKSGDSSIADFFK